MSSSPVWRTLLGTHASTLAVRRGEVSSAAFTLDFADVAVPNKAFKRVVREGEFDVAELALMTFLMARSRGVPLRLLPVTVFARNPLPYLVAAPGPSAIGPHQLAGRRVGVRSYTTTTAVWVRALLADEFGVAWHDVEWLTYEEGHVAGVVDPPNVRRDPSADNLARALAEGLVDAAIVDPVPSGDQCATVVDDPTAAYARWCRRSGGECINHVAVVRESLAHDQAQMGELFDLFRRSQTAAGTEGPPFGLAAMRPSLEAALAAARSQGLLAGPLSVADLVTHATGLD